MNQNTPRGKGNGVTIVIPVFNRENILGLTLESVLKQTYTNYRCIIVDDGSIDSSVALARKYENADARFQVVENSINSGACRCRNLGLALAESEYTVFLDSDDIWLPHYLETMLQRLNGANHFGAAACQALVYEEAIGDSKGIRFAGVSEPINLERYLKEEVAWITSCMLWKTAAIKSIGGFVEHLKMWQDWNVNVRFLGAGGRICPVPENLLYSKVGSHSQISNQIQGKERMFNHFYSRENAWNGIKCYRLSNLSLNILAHDFEVFSAIFLAHREFAYSFRALLLALNVKKSPRFLVSFIFEYLKRTRFHSLFNKK